MIAQDRVEALIKAQLPQASDETVTRMAEDIVRDTLNVLYSLIRSSVAQEREVIRLSNKSEVRE